MGAEEADKKLPLEADECIGGLTSAQHIEELRQLDALAHQPPDVVSSPGPTGFAEADVERVAAWLLNQADLTESAEGQ